MGLSLQDGLIARFHDDSFEICLEYSLFASTSFSALPEVVGDFVVYAVRYLENLRRRLFSEKITWLSSRYLINKAALLTGSAYPEFFVFGRIDLPYTRGSC
jgi:hypothetical protein